jgi:hypothetical protein
LLPLAVSIDLRICADILLSDFPRFVGTAVVGWRRRSSFVGFFLEAGDLGLGFLDVL